MKCGVWNILADGLSAGEFMTDGGDIDWQIRREKIIDCLTNMLRVCDFVVTIENDHFSFILHELNNRIGNIGGVCYIESDLKKPSAARRFRKVDNNISFIDEHADDFAILYGLAATDPYVSDDSISIYYHKNLKLIDVNAPKLTNGDAYICAGNDQFVRIILNNITIYGAHLSSGDDKNAVRENKLHEILALTVADKQPIVLADMNDRDINPAMLKHSFKNIVENHECYKMRHAQGGQPAKFGQFMFDCIDAILVRNDVEYKIIDDAFGFEKYPANLRSLLSDWRNDDKKRETLYKYCVHNKWGADMNLNSCDGLARLLEFDGTDSDVKSILLMLYPRKDAPSDHPPIAYEII